VLQNDNKHVLTKLYGADNAVERDLSAVFPFVIVPDDDLMASRGEHENNEVCLVHHLNDFNALVQVLNLFLDLVARRVVLDYLESRLCRHCEILLALIRRDHFHGRGVRRDCLNHHCLDLLLIHQTILCLNDHSGRRFSVLRHLLGFLSLRCAHAGHLLLNFRHLVFVLLFNLRLLGVDDWVVQGLLARILDTTHSANVTFNHLY